MFKRFLGIILIISISSILVSCNIIKMIRSDKQAEKLIKELNSTEGIKFAKYYVENLEGDLRIYLAIELEENSDIFKYVKIIEKKVEKINPPKLYLTINRNDLIFNLNYYEYLDKNINYDLLKSTIDITNNISKEYPGKYEISFSDNSISDILIESDSYNYNALINSPLFYDNILDSINTYRVFSSNLNIHTRYNKNRAKELIKDIESDSLNEYGIEMIEINSFSPDSLSINFVLDSNNQIKNPNKQIDFIKNILKSYSDFILILSHNSDDRIVFYKRDIGDNYEYIRNEDEESISVELLELKELF